MISRVEEKYYNNIGRIARAMEKIAAVLEKSENRKASQAERIEKDIFGGLQERMKRVDEAAMRTFEAPEAADTDYTPPIDNSGTSAELVINDELTQMEKEPEEPIKLTLSIKPSDILAVTHADDGRAPVSLAIGNNIEIQLTVEEKAEEFMDRLMDAEGYEDCSTCKYGNDTNGTNCRDCLEFDKWQEKGSTK